MPTSCHSVPNHSVPNRSAPKYSVPNHRARPAARPAPSASKPQATLRFWGVGYALLILLTGTNIATPLYPGYQARFGFSALTATLIFATYVVFLIPTLLVTGRLSDRIGRRRVLLPAMALAIGGTAVFALASNTWWLFVGRALQGLAAGAASSALTAALADLEPPGRPGRASVVATVASMGGLGLGPLLAGALAQYAPAPHVLPFVAELILLVPAMFAVAAVPATSRSGSATAPDPDSDAAAHGPLPPAVRQALLRVGPIVFLAFAVIGLFLGIIPSFLTGLGIGGNLLLVGAAVALLLASSVLAQLLSRRPRLRLTSSVGLVLLIVGLALLIVVGITGSLPMLAIAAVLAGAGHGVLFVDGLTDVNAAAPPNHRGAAIALFYVFNYAGVGVPVIGAGLLARTAGTTAAVDILAAVVAVAAVGLLAARWVRAGRARIG